MGNAPVRTKPAGGNGFGGELYHRKQPHAAFGYTREAARTAPTIAAGPALGPGK